MDRSVSLHEQSFVTALDIYGVAIRAVFNTLNKEREKGLRPRLLVLDGLAALTAAYVAHGRNLPSGFLLLDQHLHVKLAPVELRCEEHRNEAELDIDMTTPGVDPPEAHSRRQRPHAHLVQHRARFYGQPRQRRRLLHVHQRMAPSAGTRCARASPPRRHRAGSSAPRPRPPSLPRRQPDPDRLRVARLLVLARGRRARLARLVDLLLPPARHRRLPPRVACRHAALARPGRVVRLRDRGEQGRACRAHARREEASHAHARDQDGRVRRRQPTARDDGRRRGSSLQQRTRAVRQDRRAHDHLSNDDASSLSRPREGSHLPVPARRGP